MQKINWKLDRPTKKLNNKEAGFTFLMAATMKVWPSGL
jgi:hypothetical protein